MYSRKNNMARSRPVSCTSPSPARTPSISSPHLSRQDSQSPVVDTASFQDIDIGVRLPASAVISPSATAYDPHAQSHSGQDDFSDPTHHVHQGSRPRSTFLENCSPLIIRATSTITQHTSKASVVGGALHSPTKSLASFIPSRSTVESTASATAAASQPKIRALQNWFNGASSAVNLGVRGRPDQQEQDDYDSESGEEYDSEADEEDGAMMSGIFSRSPGFTQQHTSSTPLKSTSPSCTTSPRSKFSWPFTASTTTKSESLSSAPSPAFSQDDDLLHLSVHSSLFPHGPADPLSPASFNDLLSTAEALLSRYQTSYRSLHTALIDARAEQSAQAEELEESEVRVRCLKSTMEGMAARETERDEELQRLKDELAKERRAHQAERSMMQRRKSIRVIRSNASVDSGFESEADADELDDIVDEAARGTRVHRSSVSSSESSEDVAQRSPYVQRDASPQHVQQPALSRRSTLTKIIRGQSSPNTSVWSRLADEREENAALRRRVDELEGAVEAALGVVGGLGL